MVQGRRPDHLLPGRRPQRLQGQPLRRGRPGVGRRRRVRAGAGHAGAPEPTTTKSPLHGRDLLPGYPRQLGTGRSVRPERRSQRAGGRGSRRRAHRRRAPPHLGGAGGDPRRHRDASLQGAGTPRGIRGGGGGRTHPVQGPRRHLQPAGPEPLPVGEPRTGLRSRWPCGTTGGASWRCACSEYGRVFRVAEVPDGHYRWIIPDEGTLLGYVVGERVLVLANSGYPRAVPVRSPRRRLATGGWTGSGWTWTASRASSRGSVAGRRRCGCGEERSWCGCANDGPPVQVQARRTDQAPRNDNGNISGETDERADADPSLDSACGTCERHRHGGPAGGRYRCVCPGARPGGLPRRPKRRDRRDTGRRPVLQRGARWPEDHPALAIGIRIPRCLAAARGIGGGGDGTEGGRRDLGAALG